MRAATIPTLASAMLLVHCGASSDLIIGELSPPAAGSPAVIPSGGIGASAATAGTDPGGGVGGGAGSAAEAGVGGLPVTDGGAPDNAGGDSSDCLTTDEAPIGSLLHRYSFDGTGATVADSVGNANGNLVNGALLDGSGVLTLPGEHDGQPDQYLNLPNNLVSPLSEVTIVAWTTWTGGAGYQRVFDFGISDLGEVQGNSGKSYIAVMPSTGFANGTGLGAEVTAPGYATLQLPSPEMMQDRPAVVAFAFKSGISLQLFLGDKLLIESPTTVKLSDIKDVNNWVGESQWSKDHAYQGTFDEFRIYSVALSPCQLHTLIVRGPDAL